MQMHRLVHRLQPAPTVLDPGSPPGDVVHFGRALSCGMTMPLRSQHINAFARIAGRLGGGVLIVILMMVIRADRHANEASAHGLPSNPIVLENQQPGSSGWCWSNLANDVAGQIKGYASASSVNQNENITFHVTVNPAQTFTIDFYRWAGTAGWAPVIAFKPALSPAFSNPPATRTRRPARSPVIGRQATR